MVCKAERAAAGALEAPAGEVAAHVRSAAAPGVDQTGGRQGGRRAWLWVAVAGGATAFRIDRSRGAKALRSLVGEAMGPTPVSDRFPAYARAPDRQLCWAHLRRDFQAMVDRDAGGQVVGAALLQPSGRVFDRWRPLGRGEIGRRTLRGCVSVLRPLVRSLLAAGSACGCARTAAVCRKQLPTERHLWRFASAEGVPPHNNAAERALRHAVIWRKTSHGTDSEAGSRYVERVLSVVATCRQRGRDVLGYLEGCLRSRLDGSPVPSLLT